MSHVFSIADNERGGHVGGSVGDFVRGACELGGSHRMLRRGSSRVVHVVNAVGAIHRTRVGMPAEASFEKRLHTFDIFDIKTSATFDIT